MALRGCTMTDLVAAAQADVDRVQQACELLAARGQVVKRGAKYFAA